MSQRWTLSGIAITALAAMVTLISTGTSGALAMVLIWALALVVTVILLNLAWTFPVFRGLVYDNADRVKERRRRRRGRKWIADVYLTRGGIAFSVSAPPGSPADDSMNVELMRKDAHYVARVEGPQLALGTMRLDYFAMYPDDFADVPERLPVGRYKVRWTDSTGLRSETRFTTGAGGVPIRSLRVRHAQWKRSMRDIARRREQGSY